MATCAALSVADEALHATTENEHFQRLCRLLMRGGVTLLREVFDSKCPPANLPTTLRNPTIKAKLQRLRGKGVLFQTEWDRLYLPTGMHGKSADFDISLLFKLLRNICSLTRPSTGWDKMPNNTDHSLEADLVRMKYYRNSIYGHNQKMEIIDADFVNLWTEISEALLRIASSLSSAKRVEWKESIDKLQHDPLTPDAQQHVAELRTWCKKDMETKDEVEKVNIKLEQMNTMLEELTIKVEQLTTKQEQNINIRTNVESIKAGPSHTEFERAAGSSATWELQQNQLADLDIWQVILSFKSSFSLLIKYLRKKVGVYVQTSSVGSLVITVSCSSLQVLEGLWKDYCSGHLNEVIQETLVTAEVLKELNISEVKLKTIISEEEYKACKMLLTQRSAPQHQSAPQEPSGATTPGRASAAPQYQAPSPEVATPGPSAAPQYRAPSSEAATPGPSGRKKMEFLPAAASVKLGTASVSGEKLLEELPYKSYQRVVRLLQPSSSGEDYKSLAAKLGYTRKQMRHLETANDPVVELIENCQARGMKITELMSLLKEIGRDDVVEELQQLYVLESGKLPPFVEKTRTRETTSTASTTADSKGTASVSGEKLLRELPYKIYQRVVRRLQSSSSGRDYKSLAAKMGYTSKEMKYLETANDPALEVIRQCKARGMKITELTSLLKEIGRDDVVEELRGYLEQVHHHGSSKDNADYTAESGHVLIINNDQPFVFKLRGVFKNLGFTTQKLDTMTKSEMLKELTNTANKDFSIYDCFVCMIRSHASKDGIYGTDKEVISLETITSLFSRDKCPSLDGKPKIFLFEGFQKEEVPDSGTFSFPVTLEEEVLIWYSLCPSHIWFQFSAYGFVARVFDEFLPKKHLMEMMDRVNEHIVAFLKVQSWQISTLTKRVFFKSKSL